MGGNWKGMEKCMEEIRCSKVETLPLLQSCTTMETGKEG
jgi:hypothetical protein